MTRIAVDKKLEKDIDDIVKWMRATFGVKISRPEALRMLVKQYKEGGMKQPQRKPKSREYRF